MKRLSWMPGPAASDGSTTFVIATRFTYRKLWHLPLVFWHGYRLRSRWGKVEGAIGIFTGGSLLERTTYTVTAWRSEQDLRRWMGSAYHQRLMRDYRGNLEGSAAVTWQVEAFEPRAAWREALSRLAEV
jgi:hypothetical protein